MGKTVIDVREEDEYSAGHYDGAINIPLSTLPDNSKLNELSKDTPLVLYCRSGARSERALQILKDSGYKDVKNGVSQKYLESGQST